MRGGVGGPEAPRARWRTIAAWALATSLLGCGPALSVTRTRPPALRAEPSLAVAASGPYATELLAGLRDSVGARTRVVACVLGCPSAPLYASVSLTPGPHEGRVLRACQAEVYEGTSWVEPTAVRATLSTSVHELEDCVGAIVQLLLEPQRRVVRVPLDARGALAAPVAAMRAGRLDEARATLEALVASSPSLTGAWFDLGVLAEAQGREDDARRAYQQARAGTPEPWMRAALDESPLGR